jgi:hypothetical protein
LVIPCPIRWEKCVLKAGEYFLSPTQLRKASGSPYHPYSLRLGESRRSALAEPVRLTKSRPTIRVILALYTQIVGLICAVGHCASKCYFRKGIIWNSISICWPTSEFGGQNRNVIACTLPSNPRSAKRRNIRPFQIMLSYSMWHLLASYPNYMIRKYFWGHSFPDTRCYSWRDVMDTIGPRRKSGSDISKWRLVNGGTEGHIYSTMRVPMFPSALCYIWGSIYSYCENGFLVEMTQCSLENVYRYFERKYCVLLQELRVPQVITQKETGSKRFTRFSYSSSLIIGAEHSSETSTSYPIHRLHWLRIYEVLILSRQMSGRYVR